MDFIDNINESYNARYEETSETGESIFVLVDIDNQNNYRFYTDDIKILLDFLDKISLYPNIDMSKKLNESYILEYYGIRDDDNGMLVLVDEDYNKRYNFYEEDIAKLVKFFNRLKEFKVIK